MSISYHRLLPGATGVLCLALETALNVRAVHTWDTMDWVRLAAPALATMMLVVAETEILGGRIWHGIPVLVFGLAVGVFVVNNSLHRTETAHSAPVLAAQNTEGTRANLNDSRAQHVTSRDGYKQALAACEVKHGGTGYTECETKKSKVKPDQDAIEKIDRELAALPAPSAETIVAENIVNDGLANASDVALPLGLSLGALVCFMIAFAPSGENRSRPAEGKPSLRVVTNDPIIHALSRKGPMTVGRLADEVGLHPSSVTRRLNKHPVGSQVIVELSGRGHEKLVRLA